MYEIIIVGEAPTMPNSSPSKLALWMEYSMADLDKIQKELQMPITRTKLQRVSLTAIVLWRLCCADASTQSLQPDHIDDFAGNPRVIVLSDIGNEPDDQMSFVRFLMYSNELDIEGLIAATSTWQRTITHPETMRSLIRAYAEVHRSCAKKKQNQSQNRSRKR